MTRRRLNGSAPPVLSGRIRIATRPAFVRRTLGVSWGTPPRFILVFVNAKENDRRGMGEYHIWEPLEIQNCAASMQNILIQATAMGLATCWISASDAMNHTRLFSGKSWRSLLSNYVIPEYYKLQGIITVGRPAKVDELGFAVGESKHGATVWQSTTRRETEYYTIQRRTEANHVAPIRLSRWRSWKLKLYSKTLKQLVRWSASLDRRIHRLEVGRACAIRLVDRMDLPVVRSTAGRMFGSARCWR